MGERNINVRGHHPSAASCKSPVGIEPAARHASSLRAEPVTFWCVGLSHTSQGHSHFDVVFVADTGFLLT